MTRNFSRFAVIVLLGIVAGCQRLELNPTPPSGEAAILSDYVQLTHGFARAGEAYFAPDMKWIIFQASMKKDEDYSMYLAQLQWKGDQITGIDTPIRISPEGSWNSCGNFSPDGNSLIFASTVKPVIKAPPPATTTTKPAGYNWAMRKTAEVFRADGWKGAIAAAPPGGSVDLARHPITQNDGYDAECGFSPDGQWIVYCSTVTGDPEIWAMKSDGADKVQLTHNPGYDGGPFFSPDGKRICYRSDRKANALLQIFIADLKFEQGNIVGIENEKQLTDNAAVNFGPFWHHDRRHLIWGTSLHGPANFELYLMRDDGSRKTRITFSQGADLLPAFSPDGQWLMWTSQRGTDKTSQIWVARFRMPRGS